MSAPARRRARAAAIGLSAVAVAAGVPAAPEAASSRHERVPLQLIRRFPLNPRTAPTAPPSAAARTPTASSRERAPRTDSGLSLAWLLAPVACACLVVGVWIVRRRAGPARASPRSSPDRPSPDAERDQEESAGVGHDANLGLVHEAPSGRDEASAAHGRAEDRVEGAGWFRLGRLLEQWGELGGAETAYRRADERGHGAAAFNLGVLLAKRGDLAGAEEAYRRAAELDEAAAAFNLGVLLAQRGDLVGAEEAYRRAAELDEAEVANMARAALLVLRGGISRHVG